jgi:hypothetical protein
MERKKKVEMDAINEIINKQQNQNIDLLQKALKRASNIEKSV